MNAVLEQLRINLRHTLLSRDNMKPFPALWSHYDGKAIAYQHAIDLILGMIEHEAERCKSK